MSPPLMAASPLAAPLLCPSGIGKDKRFQLPRSSLAVPSTTPAPSRVSYARRVLAKAAICTATLNARCAAEQTQTVDRKSSTITIAPTKGKEKSPKLDDGGTGGPPLFGGGGWGGGGGGGNSSSGGFFFFSFLIAMGYLKDLEGEGQYSDSRRYD
ncbi:uncharacterized protein M6B38_176940 [Iris pallida]|uniref:Uncharacterized protein n=1 Tax=Iris pallida TaxID=29817 RepID=A0AAX6EQI0_IRIPA|nr:uncharacterized protein M6B38_176940 [Iris pallida]